MRFFAAICVLSLASALKLDFDSMNNPELGFQFISTVKQPDPVDEVIGGVVEGFKDIQAQNDQVEKQAIDAINADTSEKIDEEIVEANAEAKSQLEFNVNRGKINITKLNEIREEGGEDIKETSGENAKKVAEVASEASVVEIINKAAESNLIKALSKASEEGCSLDKALDEADAPVVLDASDIIEPVEPVEPSEPIASDKKSD